MKSIIDSGKPLGLPLGTDPHAAAGLLKLYLRELPEPLIPYNCYNSFLQMNLYGEQKIQETRKIMSEMPYAHKTLLKELLKLLSKVILKSNVNKMSSANVAIVFGPNLFRGQGSSMMSEIQDSQQINEVMKMLIENYHVLFEV